MAEEFHAGICGETWWNWNPTKSMFTGCNSSLYSDNSTALQMMGFGLSSSSSTSDWNQTLLRSNRRTDQCYNPILEDDINGDTSSIITTNFKPMNQEFSMGSTASYECPSTVLLRSFFEADDGDHHPQVPQEQSIFNNYMSSSSVNNELSSPSWPKMVPSIRPPLTKQHQPAGSLHFSNNTSFWNASETGENNAVKAGFLQTPFEEKPNNYSGLTTKTNIEKVRNSKSVMKKGSSEAPFKRPRLETPSPLPTFKVRKEKLGDRITALQQLVSPFGKTDTASVLHEAIEYIKFLHDQVNVLSTPYMKQAAASIQQQLQQQITDKLKEQEGPRHDLRSRGLCLVPVSSTFPADFWTPTFGGTFK